jgi:hypothetical protein
MIVPLVYGWGIAQRNSTGWQADTDPDAIKKKKQSSDYLAHPGNEIQRKGIHGSKV